MKSVSLKGGTSVELSRVDFSTDPEFDESWIQSILFTSPVLLNQEEHDNLDPIVPLCRELPLRGATSTVYLDIFAVRASGTPVLIECKLWRNPQARREVVGQLLEYAALIHNKDFSDLEAQVKAKQNDGLGIWQLAKEACPLTCHENVFIDHFTNCLASGTFDLIIAGDGIRSDVLSISKLLERSGTNIGILSLLELNIFRNDDALIAVSNPPIRIISEHYRPSVSPSVSQAFLKNDEVNSLFNEGEKAEKKLKNRQFWDHFIQQVDFNHPHQEKPKHGGNNWVRYAFPSPAEWVTCYRTSGKDEEIGIFMVLSGESALDIYNSLLSRKDEWEEVFGDIEFRIDKGKPVVSKSLSIEESDVLTEDKQLVWLKENANKFVNVFRPVLEDWSRGN